MGEPEQAGAAASPREGPAAAGAEMILTPDQRVRVFISSTLQELAGERAAARRRSGGCIWFRCGMSRAPGRI
jgi:hypothetical protein